MKKDLGVQHGVVPMPVLMIGTYNPDGSVDVMNMAWGGMCDHNKVALNIGKRHKTCDNIIERRAFTLSIADLPHIEAADFFGIASAHNVEDKFLRSGLHAEKSTRVCAPIIMEFPLTMECEAVDFQDNGRDMRIVGEILNVLADEEVLDDRGKVIIPKLNAFTFEYLNNGYYALGEKCGQAWSTGAGLMRK